MRDNINTHGNAKTKKLNTKKSVKMQNNCNAHTLLVGMKICVQPLWKRLWHNLVKSKICIPYDSVIPLIDIYLDKLLYIYTGSATKMFVFIVVSSQKLEIALISINSSMNKLKYIHATVYLTAMKMNKL